jgi:hypothetical protein
MSRVQIIRTAAALLGALLVPVLASAAGSSRSGVTALHEGVVIDPSGETAYVMGAGGGIDALSLASGAVKWSSRAAAKPLMMADGTLVAQAAPGARGELVLVTVDAGGGAAQQRIEVELPAGVRARVQESPSESFRLRAFPGDDGSAIVAWTFAAAPLRGVPSEPEPPSSAARASASAAGDTEGAVRLDLAAGRATPLSPAELEALAPEARPSRSAAGGARQLASADLRHTLRSERVGDPGRWRTPYRWTVLDPEGATVGTLEAPVSMAPFVVVGSRLFYVAQPSRRRAGEGMVSEPLRLRALDLKSGAEAWTVPVVDPAYRGPLPP